MNRTAFAIHAINVLGGVLLLLVVAWGGNACYGNFTRFEIEKAKLEQKAEELDALREGLQKRERLEVPVYDVPGEPARRNEPAAEAPLREKR